MFLNTTLWTGIYYCQKKNGDGKFEKFCKIFLPNDFEVKELRCKDPIPDRLFLVFFLPSVNRQNNVDVLYDFVTNMIELFQIKGKLFYDYCYLTKDLCLNCSIAYCLINIYKSIRISIHSLYNYYCCRNEWHQTHPNIIWWKQEI